jgi:hypothetical protein
MQVRANVLIFVKSSLRLTNWITRNKHVQCIALYSDEQIINKNKVQTLKCTCELYCEVRTQFTNLETFLASSQRTWEPRIEKWLEINNNTAAKKLEYASAASEQELSYEVEQWLKVRYEVIYYTRGKPWRLSIFGTTIFSTIQTEYCDHEVYYSVRHFSIGRAELA